METKKIKGSNGLGTPREYEFRILTALEGLGVVHEYGSLLTTALPQILALFSAWAETPAEDDDKLMSMAAADFASGEGPFLDVIALIPGIVSTPRLFQLCRLFLAGSKVDGAGCDEDGMCDLFKGHPHEVYVALVFAVIANYPDYLPFLDAPTDTTDTQSDE